MPTSTSRSRSRTLSRTLSLGLTVGALTAVAGAGCGFVSGLFFNPNEATVHDVSDQVKSGMLSCRSVITKYQQLRDSTDAQVKSVVTWNDKALSDADRLDKVPIQQRGKFHCVPLVVKDNIDVAGMPTTAGAQALATSIPVTSAEVVQRLVAAGAVILAKTNMPDFATDGINTLSSYGGQTVNPYKHSLTVYGSSGGTAAAITNDLGVIGLGTDTYGSLVQPASATGLVAIRPTQGLVSSRGILPLMTLQDTAGPMARTVEDAAAALELLVDPGFAAQGPQNYTQALNRDGLRGLKIGFDPTLLQALPMPPLAPSQEVIDLFSKTLIDLGRAGAATKQVSALMSLFPSVQEVTDLSFKCMPVDFKQGINEYLKTVRPEGPSKSLADIIATGTFLDSVGPFLKGAQAQTDTVQSSMPCQQYIAAKGTSSTAIANFMDKEGLDLLVYPAANQAPFPVGQQPPAGWYGFQALSSPTGLPSLTMPMGMATKTGAPVGLIFLARKYQEVKLIQAAYAYQELVKPRTPPTNVR